MDSNDLIKLGFKDTSFWDECNKFTVHSFKSNTGQIDVSGDDLVEINTNGNWITVPNCKTKQDIKDIARLFNITLK
jgi:pectate lyase